MGLKDPNAGSAVRSTIMIAYIVPKQMLDFNLKFSSKLEYHQILHLVREFWFPSKPVQSSFAYHLETPCN